MSANWHVRLEDRARLRASSKANRHTRATPARVMTSVSVATSSRKRMPPACDANRQANRTGPGRVTELKREDMAHSRRHAGQCAVAAR